MVTGLTGSQGIANGTISLEVADEASEAIAKVEAEKAAANEKKEG